jgi:hypothetical protein
MFFDLFKKEITSESTFKEVLLLKIKEGYCNCCNKKSEELRAVSSAFGAFTFTNSCVSCYEDRRNIFVSSDEFITIFSQISYHALLFPKKSAYFYNIEQLKRTNCFHFNCYDVFVQDIVKRNEYLKFMIKNKMIFKVRKEDIDFYLKNQKIKFTENEYAIGFIEPKSMPFTIYKVDGLYYSFSYLRNKIAEYAIENITS